MRMTIEIEGPYITPQRIGQFLSDAFEGLEWQPNQGGKIRGTSKNGTTVAIRLQATSDEVMAAMTAEDK